MAFSFTRTNTSLIGRWWWTIDRWTLAVFTLLIISGGILAMAASPAVAKRLNFDSFYFARRHLFIMLPTVGLLIGASLLSLRQVKWIALFFFIISLIFMIAVPFIGHEVKGARRWIVLGGFSLQPSEFLKPTFTLVTAWLLSHMASLNPYKGKIFATALYGVVIGLLLLQPDLGMTVLVSITWFCQLFLAGLPLIWVCTVTTVASIGLIGAYFLFPHVSKRIDVFLGRGEFDRFGDHYQIYQSLEAFMKGGLFGQGPGEGVVKKHLPDAHADFILAVIGEEFGLIVCLAIVALFAAILVRSLVLALRDQNLFIMLGTVGLAVQLSVQALINMASALCLIPTKGMTLPFLSYGGSSMLALGLGMGMMLSLTRRRIHPNEL